MESQPWLELPDFNSSSRLLSRINAIKFVVSPIARPNRDHFVSKEPRAHRAGIVHKEHITRSPSNQSSESSGRMCSIYRTLYRCLISHSARRTRTNDQPGKNTFYFSSFIPTASRGGCVLCACAPVVAPAREFLRSDVRAKTRK